MEEKNKTNLKKLRTERGLKQTEAASALGMNGQRYYYYESGIREMNYETLIKVADYFDVSIDYLIGRSEDSSSFSKSRTEKSPYTLSCIDLFSRMSIVEQAHTLGYMAGILDSGKFKNEPKP